MAYAIVTRRIGSEIAVTWNGIERHYAAKANRYDSEQCTHANAAMLFVREEGLRVDYPEWAAGTLHIGDGSAQSYVFVPGAASSHVNTYRSNFFISVSGELIY